MRSVAIILAGGKGSRLWPLSTEQHPKIMLEIFHNKTMLEEAVFRAKLFTDDILLLTKKDIYDSTKNYLKENGFDRTNIIIEPKAADTAAAITYAIAQVKKRYGPQTMVVLTPSDSRIKNYGAFYRDMQFAIKSAESKKSIVLFGVTPTFPSTGYGYLRIGRKLGEDDRETLFAIESFHEKPNEDTAKKYLSSAHYLWNSGIIVGSVSAFNEVIRLEPKLFRWFRSISSHSTGQMPKQFADFQFERQLLEKKIT